VETLDMEMEVGRPDEGAVDAAAAQAKRFSPVRAQPDELDFGFPFLFPVVGKK